MSTFRVCLAFLLPPLAIFLLEGASRRYWLCCALTACGLVPGILYALVALYRHEARPRPSAIWGLAERRERPHDGASPAEGADLAAKAACEERPAPFSSPF